MKRDLYFFIGTEAEIMKMFIVIQKAKKEGFNCKIISSGQNDITHSPFMELCDSKIDVDFSIYMPSSKNGKSYIKWFIKTRKYGISYMKKVLESYPRNEKPIMIVHGDTLSTLLGAEIAYRSGMHHVHVEGGMRSFHWFNPFPEEIDRFFSSKYADIIFCQNGAGTEIARRSFKGEAVNTGFNTNIETLNFAYDMLAENPIQRLYTGKYFVVAIHRQENLMNKNFMKNAVESICSLSTRMHCIFILHQQTSDSLIKYNLLDRITDADNITVINRLDYLQFINTVDKAEFLLADGAGNQQEMYYMGKPYLILRKNIEEKSEGLGYNAVGFNNDFEFVKSFDQNYMNFIHDPIKPETMPSDIIVSKLIEKYS